jgi:hypothetical protein
MLKSLGRRVGFVLLVAVILGAVAVPAASATGLPSAGERASESQISLTNAGGWNCSQTYVVQRVTISPVSPTGSAPRSTLWCDATTSGTRM